MDHLRPQAKGGTNRFTNLRPACLECNREKDDLDYEVFVEGVVASPTGKIRNANRQGFRGVPRGPIRHDTKQRTGFADDD